MKKIGNNEYQRMTAMLKQWVCNFWTGARHTELLYLCSRGNSGGN